MKIVIIGSGHAATVLARRMALAGHTLIEVNSRQDEHAKLLADELGCNYSSGWESISNQGDFYLLSLTDSVLSKIGGKLNLQDKLVAHTAGSVAMNVLNQVSSNFGVLYPVQSLRKEIKIPPPIPFLVNGNNQETLVEIEDFAKTISDQVQVMDDDSRSRIHLASVIVNNFTNHLYAYAERYCNIEKLDFELLFPLIQETAKRATEFSPSRLQTGPAVRQDDGTIQKQLEMLINYPGLREIYELFTSSIRDSKAGL
jgi:predicted short-subunit dehydrogenase-like oxidoreductase (DUF2520 family)